MTNGEQNLNGKLESKMEVEWYSGGELYSRPKRIKINGVWKDVLQYEKRIQEDRATKKRKIIFHCHIGDNQIIDVRV